MAAIKYSRQREAIKHYLASTLFICMLKRIFLISVLVLFTGIWICWQISAKRSRSQHLTAEIDLTEMLFRTIIFSVQAVDGYWIWNWIWRVLKKWTGWPGRILMESSLQVPLCFMGNAVTALESLKL